MKTKFSLFDLFKIIAFVSILVAMFCAPQIARAADREQFSVTELTLDGVKITNTPARLNAATPSGTDATQSAITVTGESLLKGNVALGDVSGTDRISVYGYLSYISNSQTLTNTAVIGASYPLIVLNTLVASNNVTLPQATFAGQRLTLMASASLTNTLVILDTAYQAGDITLGPNDTISYIANGTSNFVEIARSNN